MSISKKHLKWLIDETYKSVNKPSLATSIAAAQAVSIIDMISLIHDFGREFIPNFSESKFNSYVEEKDNSDETSRRKPHEKL